MAINFEELFVDLVYTFGSAAGRTGCRLGPGAAGGMREAFNRVVRQAVEENPEIWTADTQRYVVKQVGRIGRDAARAAIQAGGTEITGEIFAQAAYDLIIQQKLVRDRAQGFPWVPKIVLTPLCLRW